MDKVLELSIKAAIQYLNRDMKKFNKYRDKAISIYEKERFEESCRYEIGHLVPKETVKEIYRKVI